MSVKIGMEKEFKIGSDFELHPLKKRNKEVQSRNKYGSHEHGSDLDLYPIKKKKSEGTKPNDLHFLQYTNVGFFLITPIVLGVILGSYIDNRYNIRPVATLCLLFFGMVASFYNLYRIVKKN